MRKWVWPAMIGAAASLAACGGTADEAKPKAAKAATLSDGQYELTSEVTALASTDNTTPATPLKIGDKQTVKACVVGGKPRPELYAEMGQSPDTCEIKNDYVRSGRISAQLSCTRQGASGLVMPAMMGSFTADSFEGDITSMTYFPADGDYRMTRKVSAKRIGDCPAAADTAP